MVYPASFHKIVIIGSLYSDVFNMTVSMVPKDGSAAPIVSQGLADRVATRVATWFPLAVGSGGLSFISKAVLKEVKVNRINSAGHYQDAEARGKVLDTPVAGVAGSNIAAQLTIAATLRGAAPRALAGRGRIYLPPSGTITTIDVDGRLPAGNATLVAQGVSGLFTALDAEYVSSFVPLRVGVASNTRAGAFQILEEITVGRVIDTMRSRRSKLAEDPQSLAYASPA
jgi:hypothetical protein